jgi:hypothetical protein
MIRKVIPYSSRSVTSGGTVFLVSAAGQRRHRYRDSARTEFTRREIQGAGDREDHEHKD